MTPAGSSPSGPDNQPTSEPNSTEEATAKASHQELLEQVLQATLSLGPANDQLQPEELKTLQGVARRRNSEPLSLDTVTELVQAILRIRFRSLSASRDQWERMTQQIAETMFNDPQTLPRLQSLWTLLCEASR